MEVKGKHYHTIWLEEDYVRIIDQRWLPHKFEIATLRTCQDCIVAIKDMWVRGAPLIGITAAFGMYLAAREADSGRWVEQLEDESQKLLATRPTAINLKWAVDEQWKAVELHDLQKTIAHLKENAQRLKQLEIDRCEQIGQQGLPLLKALADRKTDGPLQIMTHCNAGWLACIDWGTATAPIYRAHKEGMDVHVWASETRPRNQGFNITAFELQEAGLRHTLIVDNAAGHLLQRGKVDLLITGADRVAANGDTANKIGTYMKAMAANEHNVPFYVAIPTSSIDFETANGVADIPIEERSDQEVLAIQGAVNNELTTVSIAPQKSRALNVSFDVTPARLVTGLITEKGVVKACAEDIAPLKPREHGKT